jgi:hypothetical protein
MFIAILEGWLLHLSDNSSMHFFAGTAFFIFRVLFIENHTLELFYYKYSLISNDSERVGHKFSCNINLQPSEKFLNILI